MRRTSRFGLRESNTRRKQSIRRIGTNDATLGAIADCILNARGAVTRKQNRLKNPAEALSWSARLVERRERLDLRSLGFDRRDLLILSISNRYQRRMLRTRPRMPPGPS